MRFGISPQVRMPRMVLASVALGMMVGATVAAFEWLTVQVMLEHLLERPLWQQAIAPGVGLALAAGFLRLGGKDLNSSTSDEYIRVFHDRNPRLPKRHLAPKLMAGVATIGSGGALGLEGPSIFAGSTIGLAMQERFGKHFRRDEAKMLLTAGAAAGVAAIFQAPATGVIFALESPYRDDFTQRALLPSLFASASAWVTFALIVGTDSVLPFLGSEQRELHISDIAGGALVGLLAGFGGRTVAWLIRRAKEIATRFALLPRLAAGAVLMAALVVASDAAFGEPLTLGPGVGALAWLINGDHSLVLIAALFGFRLAATLTSLGAGGTGGLFIPLVVQGVILGRIVGEIAGGSSSSLYPTLGLAAFLAAGYRVPIAAVMFVAESTGAGAAYVVPALVAAAASQLSAGSSSVAAYQRSVRLGHVEHRLTLPITAALDTDVLTTPPDATASEFVFVHVLGRRVTEVPVVESGKYLGMCSLTQLNDIDRDSWDDTLVEQLMDTDAPSAQPSWTLRDAVQAMENAHVDQIVVVDANDNFVGLVQAEQIVKLDEILDATES